MFLAYITGGKDFKSEPPLVLGEFDQAEIWFRVVCNHRTQLGLSNADLRLHVSEKVAQYLLNGVGNLERVQVQRTLYYAFYVNFTGYSRVLAFHSEALRDEWCEGFPPARVTTSAAALDRIVRCALIQLEPSETFQNEGVVYLWG